MANILEWIGMGRPLTKTWRTNKYVYTLPVSASHTSWMCDPAAEQSVSPADREAWYNAKPGCRGTAAAVEGMAFSESLGGFVGAGVTAPDAKKITYKPPPVPVQPSSTTTATPGISPTSGANSGLPKQAISTTTGATPVVSTRNTASLAGAGTFVGTGIGTVIGGPIGGTIGGAIGGSIGDIFGKSKCPGPYNYNPVTGGCDPKPGTTGFTGPQTQQCPSGYEYDTATMQCKKTGIGGWVERTVPGGSTGYVPAGGWTSTEAYGTTGVVPQSMASSRLICPRGYVLYGKEAGMEVCLPKGMLPNKFRKWPKSPNPALSAQDMKTLRRIGTLQKRIRRVAGNAGFTVKKR